MYMDNKLVEGFLVALVVVLALAIVLPIVHPVKVTQPTYKVIEGELTPDYSSHGVYLNLQFVNFTKVSQACIKVNGSVYHNSSPISVLPGNGKVVVCTTFNVELINGKYYTVILNLNVGEVLSYSVKYVD
jgi:hypothetical protein